MKPPPALILGVDTPIGLTVIRELGRHGVPVHGIGRSRDAVGRTSRYLTGFSIRPEGIALSEWLPERIFHTGARALFAISEDDLIALAALPDEIEGCHILTPRRPQLDLVLEAALLVDGYVLPVDAELVLRVRLTAEEEEPRLQLDALRRQRHPQGRRVHRRELLQIRA